MTQAPIKEDKLINKHVSLLLAVVVVLVAGHGALFYYLPSRIALSAAMVSGIILLVALKLIVIQHRGVSGALHTLFRRQSRH